jgi:hypothetical protein
MISCVYLALKLVNNDIEKVLEVKTVYGENLKNGIYTYSLIADGELISTKRMIKSK